MSIWERIRTVAMDTVGGPLGALYRAAFGAVDADGQAASRDEVSFTIGVIALSAKMAKADGVVTDDEVMAFQTMFLVPEGEERNVARLFNLAKGDVAGFESYAQQLADLFEERPDMLLDVLEGLFHIASADGVLHPDEDDYLQTVAVIFGIDGARYAHIKSRFVQDGACSPYDVLGVPPDIDDATLKRRYRELVAENHPDKLIARGVPEDFVAVATRKIAAINAAYEQIERERSKRDRGHSEDETGSTVSS